MVVKIGIHQANFVPWLPYFHKMAKCDIFVLLNHVQFEKNGFQNRFQYKGKWITKPVESGVDKIHDKNYVGLEYPQQLHETSGSLIKLNTKWIRAIKDTLNIKARLVNDDLFHETRPKDKTEKLIDIIKTITHKTDYQPVYVTNETAKDKYLDEDLMRSRGIEIEYCKTPKDMQVSFFEALEKWGIEGTIKQLER